MHKKFPIDFYEDIPTRTCLPCATNCSDCYGIEYNECSVCHVGYVLDVDTNTCNFECPVRFYAVGNVCELCFHDCKKYNIS